MTREEAIEKVRQMSLPEETMEILEALAPELRESEDERIRKAIIHYILYETKGNISEDTEHVWVAWLEKQKEQKPVEKEITLTSFEGTLNTFLFDFANSPIEDCEPKEYIKKHSAEILKAAYKELNAKLQQDIFEARQEGVRDGYEVAKAEQKPAEWSEFTACLKAQLTDAHNSKYLSITDEWVEKLANELLKLAPKKEIQPKQEWSEEDKTMLNNLIWAVHMKSISPLNEMDDRGKYERYEKFLTSLPERFGLKPEREWSEEDIDKMVTARARKSGTTKTEMQFYRQGIEDTLKSFCPQPKCEIYKSMEQS